MAHPHDLQNKYVAYRVDPGASVNPLLRSRMVGGVLPGQTQSETVIVSTNAARGPFSKWVARNLPWSFTFLKYVAGAVTTAPLSAPVLTGPMSGCYLFRYTQGVPMVAHVGTANSSQSEDTLAVKKAWKEFAARPDVARIQGGNPFELFSFAELRAATRNAVLPTVCGYFTPSGQAYGLLLSPVLDTVPRKMQIVQVKPMTLRPWSSLSAHPKFI
jgi:hypothetical protein